MLLTPVTQLTSTAAKNNKPPLSGQGGSVTKSWGSAAYRVNPPQWSLFPNRTMQPLLLGNGDKLKSWEHKEKGSLETRVTKIRNVTNADHKSKGGGCILIFLDLQRRNDVFGRRG